ncbi:MAG TPA: adenylate/guanylate cyclase domain-containing protein [Stellaceae bacterium]|nr:adenylate/guanylate cyclase domain-containing protein [Stellaceae bacterium]
MSENPTTAPLERRLATILSADVAGYSRLMAEDEEQTLRVFRSHAEVFRSLVAMHKGRIFNTAGDAILAEFASAVEAVRAATEIQAALRTRNDQLPENRRVQFRIGVNLGDVMVHGEDLMGDGVNVAARLQSAAEAGGVIISGSVYDQIRNKLSLSFHSLGEQSYKNIPQPVRTFSIAEAEGHGALPTPKPGRSGGARLAISAVAAVLLIALGAGAYWGYAHFQHPRGGGQAARATPPATAAAPAATATAPAAAAAGIDGLYAGEVCYGPGSNDQARCFRGQAKVGDGRIEGRHTGQLGNTIVYSGEVKATGEVRIELRTENAEGTRVATADLTGKIHDGVLEAKGTFRNGRTAEINWQRK